MTRGIFIALEGIDGSGTTTQAALLEQWLVERSIPVHRTAEPSTGTIGRLLRQALKHEESMDEPTLALLFAADRLDHVNREINPPLERGGVVITDRYLLSSLAYQSCKLPADWVEDINRWARRPDMSILLRIDPLEASKRRAERGHEEELFDGLARQQQVAQQYDDLFARHDMQPCTVLNGLETVENVQAQLRQVIEILLRGGEKRC